MSDKSVNFNSYNAFNQFADKLGIKKDLSDDDIKEIVTNLEKDEDGNISLYTFTNAIADKYNIDINQVNDELQIFASADGDASTISQSDLEIFSATEEDINENVNNLILEEIDATLQQRLNEVKADEDSKTGFGMIWNGIKGVFGGGTKGQENDIKDLQKMYENAKNIPTKQNLDNLYKAVYGEKLDYDEIKASYQTALNVQNGVYQTGDGKTLTLTDVGKAISEQANMLASSFDETVDSQGWLSKIFSGLNNNLLGIGQTENMTNAQIKEFQKLADKLANTSDAVEFAGIYKQLTGEELTEDSLSQLLSGVSMVENSRASEAMMDYERTQEVAITTVAAVATGIATATMGPLAGAAAGTAINVGVHGFDAATRNNGKGVIGNLADYATNNLVKDAAVGALNGFSNVVGNKAGAWVKGFIKEGSGKVAQVGIRLASEFIEGGSDGAISNAGEYMVDVIAGDAEFSGSELLARSTLGFTMGGVMSVGMQEGMSAIGGGIAFLKGVDADGAARGAAEGVQDGIENAADGIEDGLEKGAADGVQDGIEKGAADGINDANVHGIDTTQAKIEVDPEYKKAVEAKIAELSQGKSEIKTLKTANGEQNFRIFSGTQEGSNLAYYVQNVETGELFYAKIPNGGKQWQAEIAATKLYEAAGIDVPEITEFTFADGTKGVLSKYIPNLQQLKSPNALANNGFGMDVLLENWDSIGLAYDNTLITPDGKVIKIDNGGSFDFKAQGQNKPFTAVPMELVTTLDPTINPQAAHIYGSMSKSDVLTSLKKAVSLDDTKIESILKQYNCEEYYTTVIKRKQFMQGIISEMENTPQLSGETIHSYMQRTTNSYLNKAIDSATTQSDLDDIYKALNNVKDSSVKQKLQNKINAKKAGITSFTPKNYTDDVIKTELEKVGFKKIGDNYKLDLDSDSLNKLANSYGIGYSTEISNLYLKPLTKTDIQNIRTMLNEASKVMDVSGVDMQRVVLLYNSIQKGKTNLFKSTNIAQMTPAKWAMVLNIAKGQQISADQLSALMIYKSNSSSINGGLSTLKDGGTVSTWVQKQINDIQAYINTQVIPEDIHIGRVEGYYTANYKTNNPYGCLSNSTFEGKALDKVLDDAIAGGTQAIHELEDKLSQNVLYATNERFTSAMVLDGAISKNEGTGKVVWDLTLKKGSKGAFLEGTNFSGGLSTECEILLQANSKFEITGIQWDASIQKWIVSANVTN